jgi:hypothetical protein
MPLPHYYPIESTEADAPAWEHEHYFGIKRDTYKGMFDYLTFLPRRVQLYPSDTPGYLQDLRWWPNDSVIADDYENKKYIDPASIPGCRCTGGDQFRFKATRLIMEEETCPRLLTFLDDLYQARVLAMPFVRVTILGIFGKSSRIDGQAEIPVIYPLSGEYKQKVMDGLDIYKKVSEAAHRKAYGEAMAVCNGNKRTASAVLSDMGANDRFAVMAAPTWANYIHNPVCGKEYLDESLNTAAGINETNLGEINHE